MSDKNNILNKNRNIVMPLSDRFLEIFQRCVEEDELERKEKAAHEKSDISLSQKKKSPEEL